MKTIEEAARKYINTTFNFALNLDKDDLVNIKEGFKAGANWQKEQSSKLYTEEEVFSLLRKLQKDTYPDSDGNCSIHPNGQELPILLKEWFEQNLSLQQDAEVFFDAIMNPKQPNKALKEAASKYLLENEKE